MRKLLSIGSFLLLGLISKATTIPANPSTFVNIYNNQAVNGDTILLDAGNYTSAVAFPTGKLITLKADPAAATQPVINFLLAEPVGSAGSLTFDGLLIDRANADYFFSNATTQSMTAWKFSNCTIKNIKKAIYNTTNKTGNIGSFIIDKSTITACGTSGTSFILTSQTVDVFNVSNSTIYNYIGGDFFHPNNATTTKNISVSFINNTMYKCIWNNGYGWVSVNNVYAAGNTYLFKNNIFDNGANTDPVANKPLLVYRGNGTVTEQNNIKINYQNNNSTTTNATNLTMNSGVLAGYTTIPYTDATLADFTIASTTPFATAGVGGIAVGNPFLIKFLSQSATITTVSFPTNAGILSPTSLQVNQGDSVTLSATRNFGYTFKHWKDQSNNIISTNSSVRIKLNSNMTYTAVFDTVATYTFTTTINGSQWGTVSLTPSPTNGKYEAGTVVTATAVSNPIANFLNWETQSTLPSRTITVNSNQALTASFDEVSFIVGWDFKNTALTSNRVGDYYSETNNTGILNLYEIVNGASPVGRTWLASSGGFSPSYPHLRFWSAGAQFKTTRRHLKAQFNTTNYKNIQVKSMISGNYQAYSVMTMQYSLNDTTYTEFARVNLTGTFGSTWADLNAMLPAAAENQPKVYIKWIADETSPIINEGTDNDGTAITNIYVLADKNIAADNVAPTLISVLPANGSNSATINGSIILTFNEKVKAATGNITLGTKVLTGIYGAKTASFAYEKLSYDTEYTFTIPAGAIADMSDNAYAGLTITFRTGKRAQPTKKLFDAVVAKDGSGDYTSVIDALSAAPAGRTQPWLIFIKNGSYKGHHVVTKPFIHLIGQSRDGVILKDSLNANNGGISERSTMVVQATDTYFENFTIENTHGYVTQNGPMAEALNTDPDRFTMKNVYIRSYQDTWMTGGSHGRQYIFNSKIEGAVDFIYGSGEIFFDKDTLSVTKAGSYIVAPSHNNGATWGYVFRDNVINQNTSKVSGSINSLFGRPWQNAPRAVFINSKLLTGISPEGWAAWYTAPAIFADYGTVDANNNPVDLSLRRSAYTSNGNNVTSKNSLTDQEAATYVYENVILRTGDTWDPRMMAEALSSPTNVLVSNNTVSWDSVSYARLYIVLRNNNVIGFTTAKTYSDATAVNGQQYTYAVKSVSEFGALSDAAVAQGVLAVDGISLSVKPKLNAADLTWDTKNEHQLSYFEVERKTATDLNFTKIGQISAKGISNNFYAFTDAIVPAGNNYYRIKSVDANGLVNYSNVVSLNLSIANGFVIYPTISNGIFTILYPKVDETALITIYNLNGLKVFNQVIGQGEVQQSLDASSWAAGVYIVQYQNGSTMLKTKIVKQ